MSTGDAVRRLRSQCRRRRPVFSDAGPLARGAKTITQPRVLYTNNGTAELRRGARYRERAARDAQLHRRIFRLSDPRTRTGHDVGRAGRVDRLRRGPERFTRTRRSSTCRTSSPTFSGTLIDHGGFLNNIHQLQRSEVVRLCIRRQRIPLYSADPAATATRSRSGLPQPQQ